MFLDASAMVAILMQEDGWTDLSRKIELSAANVTSPLAIWETVVALVRTNAVEFDRAEEQVGRFLSSNGVGVISITAETGTLAIDASRRYGRGRHKANLNFGDCFAYAVASERGLPLLFKGDDFVHTDIVAA